MKFLFLLIPCFFFSQQQLATGFVIDANTEKPIPYVNISVLESQFGTSSDEDGSYTLNIKDEDLHKQVHLSSLGYKDTIIVALSLLKVKQILLSPSAETLDEVVISEKFEEEFLDINTIKKKDVIGGFGGFEKRPYIFALYLPYKDSYKNTDNLSKINVYLNKKYLFGYKSKPSKFRLRLFSVGKDSLPSEDLISKSIIVETTKKERVAKIDLSGYNITFSEEGIYVAIEWLHIPFNAYNFTYTKGKSKTKHTEVRYAPRLSWVRRKDKGNRIAIYAEGKWLEQEIPIMSRTEFMIPAISVTLSN